MVPYTLAANGRVFSHHADVELVDVLRTDFGDLATPELLELEPTELVKAMDDKAQLAQARAANKWRADVPMFNVGRVVMFRPAKTPHKSQAERMGLADVVALDPPVYHIVRMILPICGRIVYRLMSRGVGMSQRCLSGTVYTKWLMYESPFKDADGKERQEVVQTFTACADAAPYQNGINTGINTYWHRWVALTHIHQHERKESFEERDAELVAQHIVMFQSSKPSASQPSWASASVDETNGAGNAYTRRYRIPDTTHSDLKTSKESEDSSEILFLPHAKASKAKAKSAKAVSAKKKKATKTDAKKAQSK
ncbi:hypothetical protein SARC_07124 [Sphaeroforma arctica JP610]|uniref:Uncharacterized protein n=1 Tax=Sphaeroforma arctica JP610 TaxID=667725 RepID=A0A0L0FX37_9EUKA|nr:hypothetical protein SARC_07124 [Sphaeroforma arctica JP610]KNC80518.1 hypothetical protein SARC_07124 [Sphaeroforma arctica JP610]|eukprot:XP_014154420.1 hypothetical protein SARC_07124 [Sphaeroforma arctica JP610]